MIRVLILPALVAAAWPVLAQDVATTGTITVSREACDAVVEHVPAPDVEYEPGIDAYGRPVAPADVEGSRFDYEPPEVLAFALIVDLQEFFGPDAPHAAQFADDIPLGVVTVEDGRVAVDGRPVTGDGQARLARACRERYGAQ